jgi:hypothetical protein
LGPLVLRRPALGLGQRYRDSSPSLGPIQEHAARADHLELPRHDEQLVTPRSLPPLLLFSHPPSKVLTSCLPLALPSSLSQYRVRSTLIFDPSSKQPSIQFKHPVAPGCVEGGWMKPNAVETIKAEAAAAAADDSKEFSLEEVEKHNSEVRHFRFPLLCIIYFLLQRSMI